LDELASAQARLDRDVDDEEPNADGVDDRFQSKLSLAFDVSNEAKSSKKMLSQSHQALLKCNIFEAFTKPSPELQRVKAQYSKGEWKNSVAEGTEELATMWRRQGDKWQRDAKKAEKREDEERRKRWSFVDCVL